MACSLYDEYSKGDEVSLTKNRAGIIRYRGPVEGKNGEFVGIELTKGKGKHCGTFQGKRYFSCKQNRGIFIKQTQIRGLLTSGQSDVVLVSSHSGQILTYSQSAHSYSLSCFGHEKHSSSVCLRSSVAEEVFEGFTLSPTAKHKVVPSPCGPLPSFPPSIPVGTDTPRTPNGSGKWKPPTWMDKAQPSVSNFLMEKISHRGKYIEHNSIKSFKSSKSQSSGHSPESSSKIKRHRAIHSMDGRRDFRRYELDHLRSQSAYYERQLDRFQNERRRWMRKQQEILDTKHVAVQYVFMENIQTIKLYNDPSSNCTKIKIVTKDGGEVILRDIEIANVSDTEMQIDDTLDDLAQQIETECNINTSSLSAPGTVTNSLRTLPEMGSEFEPNKSNMSLRVLDESGDGLDFYHGAKHQTIIELQGRIADLSALSNIYFPSPSHDLHGVHNHRPTISSVSNLKEEGISRVIRDIELRHEQISDKMSVYVPPDDVLGDGGMDEIESIDEMLRENNEQWQYLVYRMEKEMQESNAVALQMALESRTAALENALNIANGNDTGTHSIYGHQKKNSSFHQSQHLDPLNWLSIIDDLEPMEKRKQRQNSKGNSSGKVSVHRVFCPAAELQTMVIEELLREMNHRRRELNALGHLHKSDESIDSMKEARKIQSDAIKRHQIQRERFSENAHLSSVSMQNANGRQDGDQHVQNAIIVIDKVHQKWQQQLETLVTDTKNIDDLKQLHSSAMEELDGRITDVLTMRDIYDHSMQSTNKVNESGGPGLDLGDDANEQCFNSLRLGIKDRHQGIEHNIANAVGLCDDIDRRLLDAVKQNDREWREAVFNPVRSECSKRSRRNEKMTLNEVEINKNLKATVNPHHGNWWLDNDPERSERIDAIVVDDTQQLLLRYIATYCQRVLCSSPSATNAITNVDGNYHQNMVNLYFPIPVDDTHHIISTLYDSAMLCRLLSRIDPDSIDIRSINYPNTPSDPQPISEPLILQNLSLFFSTAKSMGIFIGSYTITDWLDPLQHVSTLCTLIDGISEYKLCQQFPEEQPPLIRGLTQPIGVLELFHNLNDLHNGSDVDHDHDHEPDDPIHDQDDCKMDENQEDPGNEHNEEIEESAFYIQWINHLLPRYLWVDDLIRGLRDGVVILSVLDKMNSGTVDLKMCITKTVSPVMSPGIVDDSNRVDNWNMAMQVMCGEPLLFKFSSIEMAQISEFLKEENQDLDPGFIDSMLWQLMRFQAIQPLLNMTSPSAIQPMAWKGNNVTDNEIRQWVNQNLLLLTRRHSETLIDLQDITLSTCIVYIELLAIIRPKMVDESWIHYDVEILGKNENEESNDKRIANARLAISYIRKCGVELMVRPQSLCNMEPKAVITTLVAIMAIGMTNK